VKPLRNVKILQRVVIGIGNALRGDDGAGLLVVCRLREAARNIPCVSMEEGGGGALMAAWEGADTAIVVDAAFSGEEPPGTIHRFDAANEPVPAYRGFRGSSHAMGAAEEIELARALGRLPRRLIVYGIEGGRFGIGEEMSEAVREAAEKVAGRIMGDLGLILAPEERQSGGGEARIRPGSRTPRGRGSERRKGPCL